MQIQSLKINLLADARKREFVGLGSGGFVKSRIRDIDRISNRRAWRMFLSN